MKRAVLYTRVSTSDQNSESQMYDLEQLAQQAVIHDRQLGLSLAQLASRHHASRTTIHRLLNCSKILAEGKELTGQQ